MCAARYHGAEPYACEPTLTERTTIRGDGLGSELDIWDRVLECVPADGAVHPYGDVEDRIFANHPGDAAILQEWYGHRCQASRSGLETISCQDLLLVTQCVTGTPHVVSRREQMSVVRPEQDPHAV